MNFSLWELLAGLGFFLLGMLQLEQSLSGLGDVSLKRIISQNTRSPIQGVLVGTISTAFLQSSSLVGLITLAFVGAGILQLKNALGIIFGANLGTTFTGWLVTTIGFKLELSVYALPLIAAGALGKVFSKANSKPSLYLGLALGLGFLLFGLDFMKSSMLFLRNSVSPELLGNYPLVVYFIVGMAFSALMQSSSATMIVVLSALQADLIPLTTAAVLAIGADMGTTSTVAIGGINGSPEKKRVALSHVIFNLVTDLVALALLAPLLGLVTQTIGISDPMYALVAFHSLFNFLGILIFLPFVNHFATWLSQRFQSQDRSGARFISRVPVNVGDAALSALSQDASRLIDKTILLNLRNLKIPAEEFAHHDSIKALEIESSETRLNFEQQYADIKQTEDQIIQYAYQLMAESGSNQQLQKITTLLEIAREATYAAKSLKDIRQNIAEFRMYPDGHTLFNNIKTVASSFYQALIELEEKTDPPQAQEKIDNLNDQIAQDHSKLHGDIEHQLHTGPQDMMASSLLNINRELMVSHQSLLKAVAALKKLGSPAFVSK